MKPVDKTKVGQPKILVFQFYTWKFELLWQALNTTMFIELVMQIKCVFINTEDV